MPPNKSHGSSWDTIRLHSEIDQIHLSIEAQCVTTVLPLGDCHRLQFDIIWNALWENVQLM